MLIGDVLDHIRVEDAGLELMRRLGVDAGENRRTGTLDRLRVLGMQLEDAELALHEEDAGLDLRHGLERQVDNALDGQTGSDLDDESVLALHRRVATSARRRPHVGRELPTQLGDGEVDAQFDIRSGHRVLLTCRP